ncbi:MAG: radical SAM protein [Verrucomicrobiota bacterium]
MRLLLTSVFGPYGVDDEFGRKENKMELFHNQITREQGIFSYRFNHHSFGLQFLAQNLSFPSVVLDFPSRDRFIEEIKKGYEYVGISFIVPNLIKVQEMAKLVRKYAPKSKIILGGHGTNIPNLESRVEHDHICRGEGVAFLRQLFGEDMNRPITHPLAHSSVHRQVMGVPLPQTSGVLIPGVGCANKCRFCATSHFFGAYTPYLNTGADVFKVCSDYEEKMGVTDFGVLDENFMKLPERAKELIALMEKNDKYFTFGIFSSAETLMQLGDLDLLVRMGVTFIWIGVESKKEVYEKNKGVDFHKLVMDLRRRGISVLTSAILFSEHHDHNTIWEDVDFAISLQPDYLQFMQLGPIPGTSLYKDYVQKGMIMDDVPYEEQHGQDMIWFRHPHFTREESRDFIRRAFERDYEVNGASFIRSMRTILWGYQYTSSHADPRVRRRAANFHKLAEQMRHFLLAARLFSVNKKTAELVREVKAEFTKLFGWFDPLAFGVLAYACKEQLRLKTKGEARQPEHMYLQFPKNVSVNLACPCPTAG